MDRFWSKVDKSSDGGCWQWTASKMHRGYGQFRHVSADGSVRVVRAHRLAWELSVGPISDGLHVLHKCDNRACVNPDHMMLGTNADNMRDKVQKGRQQRGERVHAAKLDEDRVRLIRALGKTAKSADLSRMFGVCANQIQKILQHKAWKHVEQAA